MYRHIALAARADDGGAELRRAGTLDVVGIEAVEAAHEQMIAAEGEIRVREGQHVRESGIRRRVGIERRQVGIAFGRSRFAARRLRIEEALRFGQRRDPFHVLRGLAGITQARLESDAGIIGRRGRGRALLRSAFERHQ